ncbi:MAG: preprotein translocase subunit SecA [Planctomycetota bacterium]|jgi:preprotein translocase subunit SecA
MKIRDGISTGAYAEQEVADASALSNRITRLRLMVSSYADPRTRFHWLLGVVRRHTERFGAMSDERLKGFGRELRGKLVHQGETRELSGECLAWIRETAKRTLGQQPFDTQTLAALGMLRGAFVEMASGEGKSIALSMAAATRALGAVPVEIIFAREDRASLAFETQKPLLEALGLSVGLVTRDQPSREKQEAYACDVTYVCSFQGVYDYLHDRVTMGNVQGRLRLGLEALLQGKRARKSQLFLNGLHSAFIDDADQVLIDDAQRPVSISDGSTSNELQVAREQALRLADELLLGEHYDLDLEGFRVRWTPSGERALEERAGALGGTWNRPEWRLKLVGDALACQHLWQRGVTHDVQAGRLSLLDAGRKRLGSRAGEILPFLSLVEGLGNGPATDALRRMSLPRFFARYLRVAGISSTLREVRSELSASYEVPVLRVHRRKSNAPKFAERSSWVDQECAQRALDNCLLEVSSQGDAALVAMRSDREAGEAAERLIALGIDAHFAAPDNDVELFEQAGDSGRVTIITSRSLRAARVIDPARLHVIAAQPLETRRIERLFYGHAAGSLIERPLRSFTSLTDELMDLHAESATLGVFLRLARSDGRLPEKCLRFLVNRAQDRVERQLRQRRTQILQAEKQHGMALAFGGGDK